MRGFARRLQLSCLSCHSCPGPVDVRALTPSGSEPTGLAASEGSKGSVGLIGFGAAGFRAHGIQP